MEAFQSLMDGAERERKILQNMMACENFFLNGEKIDITFHEKSAPNSISLAFIRENIKDTIPEDFIFLNSEGAIVPKEDEKNYLTSKDDTNQLYYVWSDTLYSQRNCEEKNNILDFKKLEEKEEFIIYEYQCKEIKDDEEYYSTILFGDNNQNEKFINCFLNYLYEIKKEDKFRFKLEDIYKKIKMNL